jgi:hypothetical protein
MNEPNLNLYFKSMNIQILLCQYEEAPTRSVLITTEGDA